MFQQAFRKFGTSTRPQRSMTPYHPLAPKRPNWHLAHSVSLFLSTPQSLGSQSSASFRCDHGMGIVSGTHYYIVLNVRTISAQSDFASHLLLTQMMHITDTKLSYFYSTITFEYTHLPYVYLMFSVPYAGYHIRLTGTSIRYFDHPTRSAESVKILQRHCNFPTSPSPHCSDRSVDNFKET